MLTDRSIVEASKVTDGNKKIKILEAAKAVFLAEGFQGASISKIAKQSGVAKSLVFHHFENKDKLWRELKAHMATHMEHPHDYEIEHLNTLDAFLEKVVQHRFLLYQNNRDIRKLMDWQRLQDEKGSLTGGTKYSPNTWIPQIKKLQSIGEIDTYYTPEDIILLIRGSVQAAFMDVEFENNPNSCERRKQYIDKVIYALKKSLAKH